MGSHTKLVASSFKPIVAMTVFKDRLFVATTEGVFERDDCGVFRECQFEMIHNGEVIK